MDATYAMNLDEKVTAWPNLPDSAIAGGDLRPARRSSRVSTRRTPVLTEPEGTTIQRGTDIRFLPQARAAERLRVLRPAGAALAAWTSGTSTSGS